MTTPKTTNQRLDAIEKAFKEHGRGIEQLIDEVMEREINKFLAKNKKVLIKAIAKEVAEVEKNRPFPMDVMYGVPITKEGEKLLNTKGETKQ